MPNYSKSIIYKLCCKDTLITDFYIGSTCNFTRRKFQHKSTSKNTTSKDSHYKVYEFIRNNGGFDNWDMIMIEEISCENKRQKEQRERYWIEELKPNLNTQTPCRSIQEYKETCKEKIKESNKKYREKNRTRLLEKQREKVNCDICNKTLSKSSLSRHKKTKHSNQSFFT